MNPATVTRESSVQVHRALPARLWAQVRKALDERCTAPGADSVEDEEGARQWRAARAAILLMGDSGLRRAEATIARREALFLASRDDQEPRRSALPKAVLGKSAESASAIPAVWTLTVIGKRRKERTVPVSSATVAPCARTGVIAAETLTQFTRRDP